jgi:hypothetical protein
MRQMIVLAMCLTLLAGCERVVSGAQSLLRPAQTQPVAEVAVELEPSIEAETPDQDTPGDIAGTPGVTIASLGDPGTPGMWLKTTRVQAETSGRITAVNSGASARVTLLPIPGAKDAGGRLSLEAMRALGVPLTELVELQVYPGG